MKRVKIVTVCALTASVLLVWGHGSLAQVEVDRILSAEEPMVDLQDEELMGMMDEEGPMVDMQDEEMMGMMDEEDMPGMLDVEVMYVDEDASPQQEESADRRKERSEMREKMKLSSDQKDRLEALRTAFAKDMVRLRADAQIASIELREAMAQISPKSVDVQAKAAKVSQARARVFERMIALRVDSKNVLTPEQQKIRKDQAGMRGPMRMRRGAMMRQGMGPMMRQGMGPMRRRMNPMEPGPMMRMDGRGVRQEFFKRIAPPDAPETPER